MKVLYIECNMGAAGDMLMSALLELHPNRDDFIKRLNNINIPQVEINCKKVVKCGISGTHTDVLINGEIEDEEHHHHHHTDVHDIEHIVSHINVSEKIKRDILGVYAIIAEAESTVHQRDVNEIHFHEVGNMDAVADITGVCMLIDEIGADKIISSPINTGSGQVKCAHGILPVPAPATALILTGVPSYSDCTTGELCTPTGAALLKYFADEFGNMPVMAAEKIGYGMGKKDFDAVNCVRAILGQTNGNDSKVIELSCNVDDMTAEEIAFGCEILREKGALEVFVTPVNMKKNRSGQLINCICSPDDKEKMVELIFRHISTIGIREYVCNRHCLKREMKTIHTELGDVRAKYSYGYGVKKYKLEYEDIAKIARERNMPMEEIKDIISKK